VYSGDKFMSYIDRFFDQIVIHDCDLTKIRIGPKGDGGYVALEELCAKTDTLFSFGIGDDVRFELDFVNRFPNVNVILFDPTIDALPETHERFTFYKQGIAGGHEKPLGIPRRAHSILKVDVEWNEWDALINIPLLALLNYNQLIIEFHIVHAEPREGLSPYFEGFYRDIFNKDINERLFRMYYAALKRLSEYFYIFHAHPNNSLPSVTCGGYIFPPLVELSFVRKDLVNIIVTPSVSTFPVKGLDFPNKIDRPDIGLGAINSGE